MQFFNLKELQNHKNSPYLSLTSGTIFSYVKYSKKCCKNGSLDKIHRQKSQPKQLVKTTRKGKMSQYKN